ncbi:MAG: YigZ family protein [Halobacteriales archaeon]|nr:YigZ family protein [Halobacteriales archaeon]
MPGPEPYLTVDGPGEAAFEVRGSSFVGRVAPAVGVEAAEAFIEGVRDGNADASHNVPAYRVRAGGERGDLLREWSSDEGEPSGSAGKPALNVLVRRELVNVAAVVTRQFGGTELGVGGLARAYGRAVSMAVDDAGVVEREPHRQFTIGVAYDDSGTVRGVLESEGVEFEADYAETARFEVRVPVGDTEALLDRLRSATGGRAAIEAQ